MGDSVVAAQATIALPLDRVQERATGALRRRMLRVAHRDGSTLRWAPRRDVVARAWRRVDRRRRGLDAIDGIDITITPAPDPPAGGVPASEGRTLVRVTAELDGIRRGLLVGGVGGPLVGLTGVSAVGSLLIREWFLVAASVPVALAVAVGGLVLGRRALRDERADLRIVVDGVLAECGPRAPSVDAGKDP